MKKSGRIVKGKTERISELLSSELMKPLANNLEGFDFYMSELEKNTEGYLSLVTTNIELLNALGVCTDK
jgi:hypothetical protein